ncbi:MAG TPA: T9SS type A sorting domain-containing protein [Ignavibacteriaceae bacterium]|nr:T9SS type A sorting domain-containing protein [Ignavibacteriaceae bacterium]
MKTKFMLFIFIYIFLLPIGNIFSQVTCEATIENQYVNGTDFYFDIYLKRTGANDLYLGNAQFILIFNSAAYTNPSIIKQAASFWNLISSDLTSVGSNYRTNTSVTISGNQIQISINGPTPSDQEGFDASVARIDNQEKVHQIGRYKISGISNSNEYMNLQWVSAGDPRSKLFSLANTDPFISSEATGTWTNPPNQELPVEMISFCANIIENKAIHLIWQTASEVNNYGYEVERKIYGNENWVKLKFIAGCGNTNSPKSYEYIDSNPIGGSKFIYRLKQIDTDGKYTYSDKVAVEILPKEFQLYQNYPNPFNPDTKIKFAVPIKSKVSLILYSALGEKVKEIANGDYEPGFYNIDLNASDLASGVYIYRLVANNFVASKKIMLMK